ncbi:hypothetical protein BH11PSE7_BH11PSE7_31610 [soil metagenome]
MDASGIHRRTSTPTSLPSVAPAGKEKFDAQREARMCVSRWLDSAPACVNRDHTPEVIHALTAQFNAFGNVVSEQLIAQITSGKTDLVLDAPSNRNNRAFLDTLRLPDGYTLTIEQAQPEAAQSGEASSPDALASPALHPFNPQRSFAPQGGMVKMPMQELGKAHKESIAPLVEAFAASVKSNADKKRASVLVEALLNQLGNLADSNGGDNESFQFELAAQLAERALRFGNNEPLRLIVPKLPENWRHLFERDSESKDAWQDYRPLMASVERGTKPAQVRAQAARALLPLVPINLETAVNTYVAYFNVTDDKAKALGPRAIIKKIGEVTGGPGQPEKMAMTEAVGKRLREACSRANNNKPLISFASSLKGDSQALFLDVLISDDQFITAQRTVAKLASDRITMSDAQFSKFQQKYSGVVSIIGKLPYQTRMMVTNDLNNEIERIASVNADRGAAIRNLKIAVTDLD